MKNKISLLALSLLANSAVANDFKHDFSIGLDTMRYKYEEQTNDNPKFMALRSNQFGVNGAYTMTYKDWLFIQPEAKVNYGFSRYSNRWSPQYQAASEPTLLFESRLLGGVHFHLGDSLTLSPYTGVGFRFRSEDRSLIQSEGNSNIMKPKRVNQSWYVPLGLKGKYTFADTWFVTGSAEYDFYLSGKHYHYSPNIAPSPVLLKQKTGWGVKAEFLIGKQFEKVTISFGPYINYWKVNKSTLARCEDSERADRGYLTRWPNEYFEPKNTTKEVGLKLNFTF